MDVTGSMVEFFGGEDAYTPAVYWISCGLYIVGNMHSMCGGGYGGSQVPRTTLGVSEIGNLFKLLDSLVRYLCLYPSSLQS